MSVRVRYAPSPTGDPHLGILRTALFDFLFARHEQGAFILRLEDTDQKREKDGSVELILQSLQWLGVVADEGLYLQEDGTIAQRGEYGPYIQSERLSIYRRYAEQLIEADHAYACFCTVERLAEMRIEQEKNHMPPRYDGRCRSLGKEEVASRIRAGEVYVVRQKMPAGQTIVFQDMVRGEISFQSDDLDDQVLLKSDGFPTYQLANVVDDHLMEISHVLRGEEWIASTPKNLLLYKAFGWTPPLFAHLPVILAPDGKRKLSKRDGAEPVLTYRDQGYLPEAVINFLAFLGWSPGTEEEIFSPDELIQRFSLSRVQKAGAIFNQERLDYLNGVYIRKMPVGSVVEKMRPWWLKADLLTEVDGRLEFCHPILVSSESIVDYVMKVAFSVQERIKHFDETEVLTWFFFKRPTVDVSTKQLIVPKKGSFELTVDVLRKTISILDLIGDELWQLDVIQERLYLFIAQNELKNGEVLWPIRAALSGVSASPGAFEMLTALGKAESLHRLQVMVESE